MMFHISVVVGKKKKIGRKEAFRLIGTVKRGGKNPPTYLGSKMRPLEMV